jgi:hypothetical protein
MSTVYGHSIVEQELLKLNRIPEMLVDRFDILGDKILCYLKLPERAACPKCGMVSTSVKNRYQRKLVGIGVVGRGFEVIQTTTHFTCRNDDCSIKYFAARRISQGKSPYLNSLKDYIQQEYFVAKDNNHQIVRRSGRLVRVSISEGTVRRINQQREEEERAKEAAGLGRFSELEIRTLGLDELYPKGRLGGHLSGWALDYGVLLGMVKGIRQVDLHQLFDILESQGVDLSQVELVVRDLYPHWDPVIHQRVGKGSAGRSTKDEGKEREESEGEEDDDGVKGAGEEVIIVADPFHTVKRIQTNLYRDYYAPLRKKLRAEGKTKESLYLFHARWAFKTGSEKLTPKQDHRLTPILNRYPRLDQAWLLKEKVRAIYQQSDGSRLRQEDNPITRQGAEGKPINREKAEKKLESAIRYAKSRGFSKVVNTLTRNQEEILNAFDENGRRTILHYPEERISTLRRVERNRGCFKKVKNLVSNLQIGYQMMGII